MPWWGHIIGKLFVCAKKVFHIFANCLGIKQPNLSAAFMDLIGKHQA